MGASGGQPWYARLSASAGRFRDGLHARRRRALRGAVRFAGSRAGAVFAAVVLTLAGWTLVDVTFGRDPGRNGADPDARGGPQSGTMPIEPAAVAAAGPVPQDQPLPAENRPAGPSASEPPAPHTAAQSGQPQNTPAAPPPSDTAPAAPPASAPAAPAPASTAPSASADPEPLRPTAYARQYNLLVRSAPTQRSALVASLPYDTSLTLICHTTGPAVVSFAGGTTTTWDKVAVPGGKTGYVSDGWVLTPDEVTALVPPC
jgi:hypothetical protein